MLGPADEEGSARTATELKLSVVPERTPPVGCRKVICFFQRCSNLTTHLLDSLVFERLSVETIKDCANFLVAATSIVPRLRIRQQGSRAGQEDGEAASHGDRDARQVRTNLWALNQVKVDPVGDEIPVTMSAPMHTQVNLSPDRLTKRSQEVQSYNVPWYTANATNKHESSIQTRQSILKTNPSPRLPSTVHVIPPPLNNTNRQPFPSHHRRPISKSSSILTLPPLLLVLLGLVLTRITLRHLLLLFLPLSLLLTLAILSSRGSSLALQLRA